MNLVGSEAVSDRWQRQGMAQGAIPMPFPEPEPEGAVQVPRQSTTLTSISVPR
jgi:hypothetical protein